MTKIMSLMAEFLPGVNFSDFMEMLYVGAWSQI